MCSFDVVIWKGSRQGNKTKFDRQPRLRDVVTIIIFGKRGGLPGIRNIHAGSTNGTIHPA